MRMRVCLIFMILYPMGLASRLNIGDGMAYKDNEGIRSELASLIMDGTG